MKSKKAQYQALMNPWVIGVIALVIIGIIFVPGLLKKPAVSDSGIGEGGGESDKPMITAYSVGKDGSITQLGGTSNALSIVTDPVSLEEIPEQVAILLSVDVQNTGTIPISSVAISSLTPSQWAGTTYLTKSKTIDLGAGVSGSLTPDNLLTDETLRIPITELEGGNVDFTSTVGWSYLDARGQSQSNSFVGSLTIKIMPDVCSDGTVWDACSITQIGKQCIGGELVWKASVCGCDTENFYEPLPSDPEQCWLPICESTGTIKNQCTGSSADFCDATLNVVENCIECPTCANDYYDAPSTGCSIEGVCEYTSYVGDASVQVVFGDTGGSSGLAMFRTESLTYDYNSFIAFNTACGESDLVSYKVNNQPATSSYDSCADFGTVLIADLPGTFDGVQPDLILRTGSYWLCSYAGSGTINYASLVQTSGASDVSSTSSNPSMEVAC